MAAGGRAVSETRIKLPCLSARSQSDFVAPIDSTDRPYPRAGGLPICTGPKKKKDRQQTAKISLFIYLLPLDG